MQQFDFNNSRYAKLFSSKDNLNFLKTFLEQKNLLYTNYGWYSTQGRRASMPTPTDYDGVATYSVSTRRSCFSSSAAMLTSLRLGFATPFRRARTLPRQRSATLLPSS